MELPTACGGQAQPDHLVTCALWSSGRLQAGAVPQRDGDLRTLQPIITVDIPPSPWVVHRRGLGYPPVDPGALRAYAARACGCCRLSGLAVRQFWSPDKQRPGVGMRRCCLG